MRNLMPGERLWSESHFRLVCFSETELVPWKSGPQEELDYKIPVGATLVSAAGIVIFAPIASTFINGTDSYVQTVLMNINPNLILPIMLLLTIRVAMKKKPAPKVPQGLMFYEPRYRSTWSKFYWRSTKTRPTSTRPASK